LEPLYGEEPGPFLAELAYHSIAGSDFDKGLLRPACRDRALLLLVRGSRAPYLMALDALALADPDDEKTRCELLLSPGEAEIRAGTVRSRRRRSSTPPTSPGG
jgi:hypothetical protein